MSSDCAENIKDILEQRLLQASKQFKSLLEARSKILKANESKRSALTTSADVTAMSGRDVPTFLEDRYSVDRAMTAFSRRA